MVKTSNKLSSFAEKNTKLALHFTFVYDGIYFLQVQTYTNVFVS